MLNPARCVPRGRAASVQGSGARAGPGRVRLGRADRAYIVRPVDAPSRTGAYCSQTAAVVRNMFSIMRCDIDARMCTFERLFARAAPATAFVRYADAFAVLLYCGSKCMSFAAIL